jgi:uncharacterized membrane-anchored protein
MKNNVKLLIGLAIPIVVLLGITLQQQYYSATGHDYVFEIEGYDPRDLLSGNYIRFQLKYESSKTCTENEAPAYMCLRPLQYLMIKNIDAACEEWTEGNCVNGTFIDDINRFYIPIENAKTIEDEVRAGHGKIRLSVGRGHHVIKDLLINGKSWKELR